MPIINLTKHIRCAVAAIYLYEGESNETLKYLYLIIYLTQNVHNYFIFLCSSHCVPYKFTVTRRFSFTMASTAAMASGVTTRSA